MKLKLRLLFLLLISGFGSNAQDCEINPPSHLQVKNITACSATLSWHSAANVAKYIVFYRLVGSPQWSPPINAGANLSYNFTGLLPAHNYELAVRAKCTDGSVSKRKTKKATTLICMLPDQVIIEPSNAHSVKIIVQSACAYDSLHVRYNTLNGPQTIISFAAADSYLVSGLNFDSTYIFQVSSCPVVQNNWTIAETITLPKPPNIILMIVDDSRYDYYSCNGAFPFIHTPNIDRIANEGVNFKRAYVATSLCSPSRATMATGLFTLKTGITENGIKLDTSFITIPKVLGEQGYYTALVGKNHGTFLNGNIPEFDYYLVSILEGLYNGTYYDFNGTEKFIYKANVLTETDTAIAIIKRTDRPLFMWMGIRQPHYPEVPLPSFVGKFDNYIIPWAPDTAKYSINYPSYMYTLGLGAQIHGIQLDTTRRATMEVVAGLDSCIGEILKALETTDKLDNTLIIFISDNGHMMGSHWLDGKTQAYEPSMRTPLFIRFPEWFASGTVIKDQFASNLDIAPTVYEAAQVEYNSPMDGRSLKDLYSGAFSRTEVYFLQLHNPSATSPTKRAIRDQYFKYIHYTCSSDTVEELFDIANDSLELINLVNNSAYNSILNTYRMKFDSARIVWQDTVEGPVKNCFIKNPVNVRQTFNDEDDYPQEPFVYPTITDESVELYLPWETALLTLYNGIGEYVEQWKVSETFTHLVLPKLQDGMYYLRFSNNGKSVTRKIIVAAH